ncbi:uncharacterized protein Z520_03282 [Fonsecaea multimorphosa CBS 102226]|uniref:Uncharacterized protein n=1 Tax=Fonsecaea multimorphosa CBS 102226 TaxID=1442371 RepID=A0A0D2KV45_9EURO|nr:uncharacterized protein Z520_03282 [Fonsecaea multimorphosa CBS 102226]KIY00619.1 hypothetical protein Z520_03282 [Fonsecaea multimorphosa CBS 102226]OAL19009.1 hypothetical protein AYO22_10338 [Fonsecaea multimorphosa]
MAGSDTRKTVLITGCSAHGLGHALAIAFHDAGLRVFATARNPDKMTGLRERGIECLPLDVLDEESIKSCVESVRGLTRRDGEDEGRLDCLVNNAGGGYNMPVADISIPEAKALFDLNVWSCIAVTQAFLPLLINAAKPITTTNPSSPRISKSKSHPPPSLILNNTSVSSVEPTPHNSAYHASKAATAMFSTHMRIELQPFNIHVIDLKTGCVHSNFHANHQDGRASLPGDSIYAPVREQTESAMRNAFPIREDPGKWAKDVVRDVLGSWDKGGQGGGMPLEIWRGTGSWRTWFYNCTFWPTGWWDEWWRKAVGLDLLREKVRKSHGC